MFRRACYSWEPTRKGDGLKGEHIYVCNINTIFYVISLLKRSLVLVQKVNKRLNYIS